MTLRQWILDQGGPQAVAELIGESRQRVHYWATGRGIPRPAMMGKLIRLSRGKLTLASFFRNVRGVK